MNAMRFYKEYSDCIYKDRVKDQMNAIKTECNLNGLVNDKTNGIECITYGGIFRTAGRFLG